MNWDALGAIGELVGAVAVVITVAYLAYQIRQYTSQMQSMALTSSIESMRENRRLCFESEELSEIYLRGSEDPEQLSEDHRSRYRMLMHNSSESLLEVYMQAHASGLIEMWSIQGKSACERLLGSKGGRWFWAKYSDGFTPSFRAEVDRILSASEQIS